MPRASRSCMLLLVNVALVHFILTVASDYAYMGKTNMDWVEIGKWAAGVIAAVVGAGLVFKLVVNKKSTTTTNQRTVVQNNNKAGRDIIGGDSINNSKR